MFKRIVFILSLAVFTNAFAFGQNMDESDQYVLKITLTEGDAINAKQLKGLDYSQVFKGESRTVFLLKTSSERLSMAKEELISMFEGIKVEILGVDEKLQLKNTNSHN